MLPNAQSASTRSEYLPASPPAPAIGTLSGRGAGARIRSIDIARGAVMVLMALDHVRVYAGVPAGGATAALFLTRWVTNFCAPAFFFLAGTGAYLYARKIENRAALARWLRIRGLWLVALELTVIRFAWTFNFDYAHYMLGGVIWSLGWCMVLMAGLVFLPVPAVAAIGVAVIALHNAVLPSLASVAAGRGSWLWNVLYFGGPLTRGAEGSSPLILLYSIIPWIGVMAAGYAFGAVTRMEPRRRDRICVALGAGALIAFLVLRGFDLYGDPRPWSSVPPAEGARGAAPSWIRFLNTAKYPASLSFLLMTLGPVLLLLPVLERARGRLVDVLVVFGRVPLFFYLLHIPLIHLSALFLSLARHDGGAGRAWLIGNHPMLVDSPPDGYRWGLGRLYLVWLLVVVALYFPCRWFADLRARRPDSLLRFL